MDKIPNKFTQPNIGPKIPPHLNKYHILDKKNDDDMIKKIFMSIEEGNIGKIHEEFNNNTSSFIVKDINDESVLHAIVKSSNLTKDEKYDLCKYVLKRGVPVNSYNKLNITPLHIASKMQLEKIVKLLLEKGANPSSLDNQNMNSLHYAVQSKVKLCENKEVKKMIKKNNSENKILKELFNYIVGIMHKDNTLKIYTNHIKNTVSSKNLYAMYWYEISKIKRNFEKNIMAIAMNNDISNETKKKQIIDEQLNATKKIEEFIKTEGKLKTLNELSIKPNSTNGWGPDSTDLKRYVLPYKDHTTMIEQTIKKYISIYDKKIDEYKNETKLFIDDFTKLDTNMDVMYISLNNIVQLLKNYDFNTTKNGINNIWNGYIDVFYTAIDNLIQGNWTNPFFDQIDVIRIGSLPIHNYYIFTFANKLPIIYRGTKEEVDDWKSANKQPQKYQISLLNNIMRYDEYAAAKVRDRTIENDLDPNKDIFIYQLGTFLDKMKSIIKFVKDSYVSRFSDSCDELINQFKHDIFAHIYNEHIKYQMLNLINISIYLKSLKDEFTDIYIKIIELNKYLHDLIIGAQQDEFVYLIHHATYEIDNLTKTLKQQESQINIVYNKIYDLNQIYTKLIDVLMLKSSANYIDQYNLINFTDVSSNSHKFNGYSNPLFMRDIPQTLDDFPHKNMFNTTQNYIKHIIEKYLPQITCANYATYYISPAENNQIINYFIYDPTGGKYALTQISQINPKKGIMYFNKKDFKDIDSSKSFPNPDLIKIKCDYMLSESTHLDDNDSTYRGDIGFDNEKIINKEDTAYPSIYLVIGHHFNVIKYRMIQHIMTQLYNKYDTDTKIKDLKSTIEKIGINKPEPIIDVIIATFSNEILNAFINYQLSKNCKIISNAFTDDAALFSGQFAELHNNRLILMKNSDYLEKYNIFSMHMNEIINSLLLRYIKKPDVNLLFTFDLAEKKTNEQQNDNVVNYINNLCVTIKPELVHLLIKYRANINQRNIAGETPLFYAIENQHYETVRILLEDYKAHIHITNKTGISPYQLILSKLKEHYELFSDDKKTIFNMTSKSYNKIKDKLLKKPEYGNNVLLYSKNIFPILLTLINYNLLDMTTSYLRNWTYQNTQSLFNLLGNKQHDLFKQLLNADKTKISTERLLNDKKNALIEERIIFEKKVSELSHQLAELNKESPLTQTQQHKQKYIQDAIKTINDKIQKINDQINKIPGALNKTNKYVTALNKSSTNDKYDELNYFIKIINKEKYDSEYDIRAYQDMWDIYLNNPDNFNSLIYIHLMISKYMGNQMENDQINDTDIKLIEDWYENIPVKFIKDYLELPQELNDGKLSQVGMEEFEVENYALDKVITIMEHTMKSTIFANLFYTIVKSITKYVEELISNEQFDDEEYGKYLDDYVSYIIYNKSDKTSDLMEYILDKLPLKSIKYVLKLYSGSTDPDNKISSIDELFNPIKTIIMNNTTVPMNESSTLIKNLDEYIYPYFKDNIEIFVMESKMIVDNYFKNIMTEYNKIRILRLFIKQ